jgi:uncharacterized protein YlxW (UPF0749 family)
VPDVRASAAATRRWKLLVPVVCLVAGLGFAVSARASRGSDIRPPVNANLAGTVRSAEDRVHTADREVQNLQAELNRSAKQAGGDDSAVADAQARVTPLQAPAGLTAVHGPGLVVVLDDASSAPPGVDPNIVLVHQSDLQAVVNALWAGGAEAMSIAGQRVIATSAVRCVGPTLLLNGEVYSPPFRVAAIGPSATMQKTLAASPGVKQFREAAGYYGLGYTVETVDSPNSIAAPAYRGSISLSYAHVGK